MKIIKDSIYLSKEIKKIHKKNETIVFVPTMGNLHLGHMKLIETGKKYANKIIVSIFVNPIQFDNIRDFKNYPISLKEDIKILIKYNVDILFCPKLKKIYSKDLKSEFIVKIPNCYDILESKSRPNHFNGVVTIICKLFNLISPDIVCLGKKDFQQLFLISKLIYKMNYNIQIISVPTVRDKDGLALSSRNSLLNIKERKIAHKLYKSLLWISKKIKKNGISKKNNILLKSKKKLLKLGFKIDFLTIKDSKNLLNITKKTNNLIILCSATIGNVRLIDNLELCLYKKKF